MEQHDAEMPQHPSGESDEEDTCGPPRKRARPATLVQPMITTLLVASARNDAVEIGALETDKRLKQTPLFDVPAATQDDGVVATIYSWTFDPPFDHALKGCSYFGQTKQTIEVRTRQHKCDSIRDTKELGLHALWKLYPREDHWVIQVLETRRFETDVDALAWMNEEEMRLIETHGGVLRDMDKKLRQTLNLTRGGQGDPRVVLGAITALSRRRLSTKVWPKMKKYYEDNKHLRIRQDDPELGSVVESIRQKRCYLQHADFKAWLDERGFIYDMNRAHLELDVWPKFKDYYENNKHLRIRQDDELGSVVNGIRTKGYHLQHADFKAWLDERGFIYDMNRAHLELDVWPKFKDYYENNTHLRIRTDDPELGSHVDHIRQKRCFLQYADFKAWLDKRGFIYDERRAHLELDVWPKLKDYYANNKHLRIRTDDPELGNVVNGIRTKGYFLQYAEFAMWLWCARFKMHARNGQKNRERWTQVFDALSF